MLDEEMISDQFSGTNAFKCFEKWLQFDGVSSADGTFQKSVAVSHRFYTITRSQGFCTDCISSWVGPLLYCNYCLISPPHTCYLFWSLQQLVMSSEVRKVCLFIMLTQRRSTGLMQASPQIEIFLSSFREAWPSNHEELQPVRWYLRLQSTQICGCFLSFPVVFIYCVHVPKNAPWVFFLYISEWHCSVSLNSAEINWMHQWLNT